jgi:hypothetical protein
MVALNSLDHPLFLGSVAATWAIKHGKITGCKTILLKFQCHCGGEMPFTCRTYGREAMSKLAETLYAFATEHARHEGD